MGVAVQRRRHRGSGEYLAGRIPGARLVTLEHSAHAPILEEVELVNATLLEFL